MVPLRRLDTVKNNMEEYEKKYPELRENISIVFKKGKLRLLKYLKIKSLI